MENKLEITISKPFGPLLGKVNIPEYLINKLNNFVDEKIEKNETIEQKLDHGSKLVGQVTQEIKIPEDILNSDIKDYLYTVTRSYIKLSLNREIKKFELIAAWIVRQFENEYNPIHFHGGHLSGAGYLKLPDSFGESFQKGKLNQHGNLNFVHGTGQFLSKGAVSFKPQVGDFYIFPNYLYHSVNPFFGRGERRSISFNANIDDNIYNVYSSNH